MLWMKTAVMYVTAIMLQAGCRHILHQSDAIEVSLLHEDQDKWQEIIEDLTQCLIACVIAQKANGGLVDEGFARSMAKTSYAMWREKYVKVQLPDVSEWEKFPPYTKSLHLFLANNVITVMNLSNPV